MKQRIMNDSDEFTTWDGKAVASEPPHGASIIVYRKSGQGHEFLILHRGQQGPDFSGDWAWTPPSGARYPGESIEECARRELREETGFSLPMRRTELGSLEWVIYMAECPPSAQVDLSEEHDRYEWLPAAEAVARCRPRVAGNSIEAVAGKLAATRPS
ncbi:MAG TPA: NUDIX domain-containing protein [Anaerolineales bacterium]|nr:NUDIX domain-containing protein [Anaerolineales bacterium]